MDQMNSDQRLLQWQKRQLVLALIATCLLAVVLATLAWLNYSRSLQTVTEVHVPSLWIDDVRGVNAMNLGEIDVMDVKETTAEGKPCRRYAFAVCSNNSEPYYLQLAYTTNIGFDYTIYAATESDTLPGGSYVEVVASEKSYYYSYGEALAANKTQAHDLTYRTVTEDQDYIYSQDYVQPAAEPVYWRSAQSQEFGDQDENGTYIRYYVLEISWSSSMQNSKETDMVYLMAGTATT